MRPHCRLRTRRRSHWRRPCHQAYSSSSNEVARLGSLITARTEHTTTLLPNGNVLVVGGYGNASHVGLLGLVPAHERA